MGLLTLEKTGLQHKCALALVETEISTAIIFTR